MVLSNNTVFGQSHYKNYGDNINEDLSHARVFISLNRAIAVYDGDTARAK